MTQTRSRPEFGYLMDNVSLYEDGYEDGLRPAVLLDLDSERSDSEYTDEFGRFVGDQDDLPDDLMLCCRLACRHGDIKAASTRLPR